MWRGSGQLYCSRSAQVWIGPACSSPQAMPRDPATAYSAPGSQTRNTSNPKVAIDFDFPPPSSLRRVGRLREPLLHVEPQADLVLDIVRDAMLKVENAVRRSAAQQIRPQLFQVQSHGGQGEWHRVSLGSHGLIAADLVPGIRRTFSKLMSSQPPPLHCGDRILVERAVASGRFIQQLYGFGFTGAITKDAAVGNRILDGSAGGTFV